MWQGIKELTITPGDYLWEGAGIPGVYCMGIQQMGMAYNVVLS